MMRLPGVENELEALPGLHSLLIASPEVTDKGLVHLQGLSNLGILQISCPKVTDAGLVHLKPLRELHSLKLECSVTDAGMRHLRSLENLRRLECLGLSGDPVKKTKAVDALESPTQTEFVEVPLSDALEYLSHYHDIQFQLDDDALRAADVDIYASVTCTAKNVPLHEGLSSMLGPLGLDWMIGPKGLTITTPETVAAEYPELIKLRQALPNLQKAYAGW
jgi:hypothetical protein